MLFTGIFFRDQSIHILIITSTSLHGLLKSLLCLVPVSVLQPWRWGWWVEPTAVRGEWKWSTKENGTQWMITTGTWRRQLWCADSWGVELPLMLPEGLILDQGLAPLGFSIFTAKEQSQSSQPVLILFSKTIVLRAFPMTRMWEQCAHVSPVWSGRGSPTGKALVSFPE